MQRCYKAIFILWDRNRSSNREYLIDDVSHAILCFSSNLSNRIKISHMSRAISTDRMLFANFYGIIWLECKFCYIIISDCIWIILTMVNSNVLCLAISWSEYKICRFYYKLRASDLCIKYFNLNIIKLSCLNNERERGRDCKVKYKHRLDRLYIKHFSRHIYVTSLSHQFCVKNIHLLREHWFTSHVSDTETYFPGFHIYWCGYFPKWLHLHLINVRWQCLRQIQNNSIQ